MIFSFFARSAANRKRVEEALAKGLCVCGKPLKPGFKLCEDCLERQKVYNRRRQLSAPKVKGLSSIDFSVRLQGFFRPCGDCGKMVFQKNTKRKLFCEDCLERHVVEGIKSRKRRFSESVKK